MTGNMDRRDEQGDVQVKKNPLFNFGVKHATYKWIKHLKVNIFDSLQ